MTDTTGLEADARVGMQVEVFLRSEVGRYILGRAEMEEREATEDLIVLKSNDFHGNRDARNRIAVARMLRDWLTEAVQSGIAAGVSIREQDDFFNEVE